MTDFDIGDCVQVKDWDEMAEHYGTLYGAIKLPGYGFVQDMKHMCGKVFHITEVVKPPDVYGHEPIFRSAEGVENDDSAPGHFWKITRFMVKPYDDGCECDEVDASDWATLLHC